MDEKKVCPKCSSHLIQQITNGERCGQCGHQFNMLRVTVPRIERSFNATGYALPPEPPPIWGNPIARSKK
jgi:tRNA(Ile2) C34 agmatinyltransferase TiaS